MSVESKVQEIIDKAQRDIEELLVEAGHEFEYFESMYGGAFLQYEKDDDDNDGETILYNVVLTLEQDDA